MVANPNRPWEQNVPIGTGAGKYINRDNYIAPPAPKRSLPDKVAETPPLFATYGEWTGDLYADILVPPKGAPVGCYYEHQSAQHAVDFLQSLYQSEGRFAGHNLRLMWWQERLVRYVFGWMTPESLRLIKRVYLEIPRKNGKSMFAAALALLMAYADNEGAPLVAFAATDKEQSGDTYLKARYMVEGSEYLANESIIYGPAKKIIIPNTHGEIRALSSKSGKLYGLNLHGLVFDELMVQRNRELWDALTTAQGAREQSLIIAITTAGWNKQAVAYEQHEYTRQLANGTVPADPTFLGVLYGAPEDADWSEEATWIAASPSMGETVSIEYYREKCKEALAQPSAQNGFRTLFLCQWVGQATRLIVMADWDSDKIAEMPDSLDGEACYGGLDLSSTTDLTAFVLDFRNLPEPGMHVWLPRFFLPGDELRARSMRDRVDYQVWVDQGLLTLIPGPVIRDEYIRDAVREAGEKYDIKDISYDRWGAVQLSRDLTDDGFTMVKMGQGYASMSAPTKECLRLVASHKLVTGGNPVLRWMADNVSGIMDPAGNVKFDKAESASRIDGLVAGVMALDGAMRRGGAKKKASIYDSRGPDDLYSEESQEVAFAI